MTKTNKTGLDYDAQTLKLLHGKEEKQMIMLDKEAREYSNKIKLKDAKVEQLRNRQRAMSKK